MNNLANAFEIDKTKDLNLPILIMDDICTTGSTFEEMINALNKNNLKDITCIASSNP